MVRVFVDNLEAGMVLAADLRTPTGRFVLAEGAALQAEHLKILKSWGVTEAQIVDGSHPSLEEASVEIDPQSASAAEDFLRQKFEGADLEHEMLAELYYQSHQHLAEKISAGFTPPVLTELPYIEAAESGRVSPAQLIRGEDHLASLPNVYNRIVEMLNSPSATASMIADIVSKDSSLSVRLLRLVNSAFYGLPSKIDSISRGISLLGTNELQSLSKGVSVIQEFKDIPRELIDMEAFWKHSIRCGLVAQALASHKNGLSEEKLFIGGLLHDIGRLAMIRKIPKKYTQTILIAREEKIPLFRAEQKYLHCDHAEVGRMLAKEWQLTPSLINMIGGHHNPAIDRFQLEACIVHLADLITHASDGELLMTSQLPPLHTVAWDTVGLSPSVLGQVIRQVDRQFCEISSVFLDSPGAF